MSNESKFLPIQQSVCVKEETALPKKDKICPTCIPEESFDRGDWWNTTEPYLNKKLCMYEIAVSINDFGDSYHMETVSGTEFTTTDPEDPLAELRRTFIQTGLRRMLRHYGKKEADEIVCASIDISSVNDPSIWNEVESIGLQAGTIAGTLAGAIAGGPIGWGAALWTAFSTTSIAAETQTGQNQDQARCGSIIRGPGKVTQKDLDKYIKSTSYIQNIDAEKRFNKVTIDTAIIKNFPAIRNPQALELYARADEHYFTGPRGQFMVLVGVPAYIFDMVPPTPPTPTPDVGVETLVIKANDLAMNIEKLQSAINIFSKYQSYFYEFENGRLYMNTEIPSGTEIDQEDLSEQEERDLQSGFSEQSPDALQEPFYLSFYSRPSGQIMGSGRFDKFLRALKGLLEKEPANIDNLKFEKARARSSWNKKDPEELPDDGTSAPQDTSDEWAPTWGGGIYTIGIGDEFKSLISTDQYVHEIKFVFDKEEEIMPYRIKEIWARIKNCEFEKVVEGFPKWGGFC